MKLTNYQNMGLKMEASPRYNLHLQEGVVQRFKGVLNALTNGHNGLVKIIGARVTSAGSDFSVTPGALYYNGELFSVEAQSLTVSPGHTAVWQIADVYERQALYGDGRLRDTFYQRKMQLVSAPSGGGLANWDGTVDFAAMISAFIGQQQAIDASINALISAAPGALDTLNELAAALGDDPDFATTMTNLIGTKVSKSGDTMSGELNMGGHKILNIGIDPAVYGDWAYLPLEIDGEMQNNAIAYRKSFRHVDIKIAVNSWVGVGYTPPAILPEAFRPDSYMTFFIHGLPVFGTGWDDDQYLANVVSGYITADGEIRLHNGNKLDPAISVQHRFTYPV